MFSLAVHLARIPVPIISTPEDEPADLILRVPIMANPLADQFIWICMQARPQGHPEFPVAELPYLPILSHHARSGPSQVPRW